MNENSINQRIVYKGFEINIKREDLLHPLLSGNKFRKLKYNLVEAERQSISTILSFGGAYSNHIAALAAAGKSQGIHTIGIIRGDELAQSEFLNPTLETARENGMQLIFVDRVEYRRRNEITYHSELKTKFGDFYLLPEGGTNDLAILGCAEILEKSDNIFDYICVAVGTGGTIAGIINSSNADQHVLGFAALKGNFLTKEICKFAKQENWKLVGEYTFGGYAKIDGDLVDFINSFYRDFQILLDPIYTAKMMFGIFNLIDNHYFPENTKILAIHTGGIQAITGMNLELSRKNLSLINIHA